MDDSFWAGYVKVSEKGLPDSLNAMFVVGIERIDDESKLVLKAFDPAGPCNERRA